MGRSKVRTEQLLEAIERETGVSPKDIRLVLNCLGRVVGGHLKKGLVVHLDGFGAFTRSMKNYTKRPLTQFSGKKIQVDVRVVSIVSFSQSRRLKETLIMTTSNEEEGMDKFAVDQTAGLDQGEQEKRAEKGCPLCGKIPTNSGGVLLCPTHGSEPFE